MKASKATPATTTSSGAIPIHQTIEILAKQILQTSKVLPDLPQEWFNNEGKQDNLSCGADEMKVPYLTSLEKVLDIEVNSSDECVNGNGTLVTTSSGKNEFNDRLPSSPKLLTCTDFKGNPFHPSKGLNNYQQGGSDDTKPQLWSPPLESTNDEAQCQATNITTTTNNVLNIEQDFIMPSLEDYAPFNADFYISIGKLMTFIYSQTSSNYSQKLQTQISSEIKSKGQYHQDEIRKCNLIEQYSLRHDVDTVRITRILSTLMNLDLKFDIEPDYQPNIGDDSVEDKDMMTSKSRKRKQGIEESDPDEHEEFQHNNRFSFIDVLLYHIEHNTCCIQNNGKVSLSSSKPTIPFIQALFKHYSTLPQLESHVHNVIRKHKAISANGDIDARIEHMKRTQMIQERLEKELQSHISSLEGIIGTIYLKCDVDLRMKTRLRIGNVLHNFVMQSSSGGGRYNGGGIGGMGIENTSGAGIDSILKVLLRILEGVQVKKEQTLATVDQMNDKDCQDLQSSKVQPAYEQLLINVLLPLHKPSGMVLWRDQTPILGLYHVTLVQCIGVIASLDTSFVGVVIKYLIHPDVWPMEGGRGKGSAANTPKVILLLHEIDTLIGLLNIPSISSSATTISSSILSETIVPLVTRLATSISSDNSRTSERALEFFKNEKFKSIIKLHLSKVMAPLLRGLCRLGSGMDVPWNPTVRKMTLLVLRELESFDKNIFNDACAELSKRKPSNKKDSHEAPKDEANSILIKSHDESPSIADISLKKSMGKWKPPSIGHRFSSNPKLPTQVASTNATKGTAVPPLTVTGVAPWSVKNFAQNAPNGQPPLTVTGVAPWATKKLPKAKIHKSRSKVPLRTPDMHGSVETKERESNSCNSDFNEASWNRIESYIRKLKQSQNDNDESKTTDGISEWSKMQMAESPLLLPSLKFHDLVFGQVLGTGSFSTVKYARQILKGKTRSHWPEFAVKVISTEKIEELGYEHSVNREIAILQTLCHPGIARLVSSFRFREGAYLVLEYGSGGDLHSLLKQNGSLDENSTRFVVGELVAALHSIHEMGMVYVDLKPENILVTESGHVKITDFGGCRPLTEKAKLLVKHTGHNLLKHLRDGDWRDTERINSQNDIDDVYDEAADDTRIEGTTAYLPPEVILGGYPTFATDSWALGCVFYQCLAGKPPLLENSESRTKQKIVTFNVQHKSSGDEDLFSVKGSGSTAFSEHSIDLIKKLLSPNPDDRPNMTSITAHNFFDGLNVFHLFKRASSALVAGRIKPQPNAQWTRRQFSSIWAPQPQSYNLSSSYDISDSSNSVNLDGPIIEGDESNGSFLSKPSRSRPMLFGIAEKK